jgi:uncharacterized membrane protein
MARVVGADTRRTPATATGTGRTGGALRPPVEEEPVPEGRLVPPRWVPRTSAIICLLAVADSVYLTYTHFTNPKGISCFLAKPGSVVNCALVTTSRYSYFFGSLFHHLLPVALAGLVWSVAMLALCSPWAWRAASPWVARARLAGSLAGVATVLWLLYAELIKLRHICEYCTVVHILTFALFVVLILGSALAVPAEPEAAGLDETA